MVQRSEVEDEKEEERDVVNNLSDGHGRGLSAYNGCKKIVEDISDIKTRTVNPLENDSSFDASGSSFNGSRSDINEIDHGVKMEASHNIGQDIMKERTYNFD